MVAPQDQQRPGLFPELTGLQREAAALAGRLRAAEAAAAQASARDPSGQVRVALTPAGRIGSVEVAARWRDALAVSGLGSAVLAAYQEACGRRVQTWAAKLSRSPAGPADEVDSPQPGPGHLTQPGALVGPGLVDAYDSIRQLWYVLSDATDRLDDLAQEVDARSTAAATGRDAGGRVTATLTGTELTGLDLDERWLARASSYDIGAAVTEAVAAAYAAADRPAEDSVTRRWPFPDLERLTGDTPRLLASLGLPTPATPGHDLEGA